MGCCCEKYHEDILDNDTAINMRGQQNKIELARKYREEGKKLYNAKEFGKAAHAYKMALENDPRTYANYTNLALAQKAANKLFQSILTIDKMEDSHFYELNSFTFLVKGKIIRARCWTVIAKNYCIDDSSENSPKVNSHDEACELIGRAIGSLNEMLADKESQEIAQNLHAREYLKNAIKVNQYLKYLQGNTENKILIGYLQKRLSSEDAKNHEHFTKVEQYFETPLELISQIEKWELEKRKQGLKQNEDQEFLVDPITYEQFQNPIIVKSGLTYEETPLKQHYQKNGSHDPITRERFFGELGVVNKNLKTYISETQLAVNKEKLIFMEY